MQLSKEATLLYIVLRQPFMNIKRTSKRYLCSMVSSGWMTYKLNANSFQEKTVPIRYHLFIHSHDRHCQQHCQQKHAYPVIITC